jgi:hypothetical protein
VRRRPLGPGIRSGDRQEVDDQLTQDAEDGGVGHGETLTAATRDPPALAPTVHHLGR